MGSQLDRDYQLLSDAFPRIAKALLLMRGYPESAVYVDKLLADSRGGARTGFPPEVLELVKKGREHGIFPDQLHDGADETKYAWSGDNYGPIKIPQAGKTVSLTIDNLPLYKILIRE